MAERVGLLAADAARPPLRSGPLSLRGNVQPGAAPGCDSGHPGPRPAGALRASKIASCDFVEPMDGILEIEKLLKNWELVFPSEPLVSTFVAVDSASSLTNVGIFAEFPTISSRAPR